MKLRALNILKVLLLALYVSYYAASTLFPHSHIVDGKLLTHSHPYLPSAHHQHSTAAFQLIQNLNTFIAVSTTLYFTLTLFAIFTANIISVGTRRINLDYASASPLRGPPVR